MGFVRAVVVKKDGADVRLKLLDLRGAPSMVCLRVDNKYWPTAEVKRLPGPRLPGGLEPFHWRRSAVVFDKDSGVSFRDLASSPPPSPATEAATKDADCVGSAECASDSASRSEEPNNKKGE